jgi:hypothetical protein
MYRNAYCSVLYFILIGNKTTCDDEYLHGLPGKRPRITGYGRIRVLMSTAVSWVQPNDYISSIISIIILMLSDYIIILLLLLLLLYHDIR